MRTLTAERLSRQSLGLQSYGDGSNILLRNCLLLEAHGFEGFCRLTVQPHFDDAALANSENYGRVRVYFDSLSTPRVEVVGDDDRLTVLDELQRLDHHALERLEKRVPEAPRRGLAPVDACLKTIRTRPIDHEIGV